MKSFYYFKLFQLVIAYVLLCNIISFDFCGKFVDPQCLIKSATPTGQCHVFSIFGHFDKADELNATEDLTKWFELMRNTDQALSDDEKNAMDSVASQLPTGDQCVPLNISIVTAFKNSFYDIKTDLFDQTADIFAHVQYFAFLFVIMLLVHALGQQSSEYDWFGYLCVIYGVILWVASTAIIALLSHKWTARWECTNFVPVNSAVLLSVLILSVVLLCSSVFELFFSRSLLQKSSDNREKSIADNNRSATANSVKKAAVAAPKATLKESVNVKNGELLVAVRVIKC